MTKRKPNEIQTADTAVYRFLDFELHPQQRMLKRSGEPVPLPPKTFDALLYLIRRAGRLVTKQELIETLWPSTFVTGASLTNTVVALRKVLGRDAIQTLSKHGYRFEAPVQGEPGVTREVYSRFMRARELTLQRSLDAAQQAFELYWTCLAEAPEFAPAWAWLGRTAYQMAKFTDTTESRLELADAAFRRSFAIDPDLACAHQFVTAFEADTGNARRALGRLLDRLERHPAEPESLAGLVQVFRYCGLLEESVEAHGRARELDPTVVTSVAHTLFLRGEYAAAVGSYAGRAGAYLDAAAWAAMGEETRAVQLLRERIERTAFSGVLAPLMKSLLAVVERRFSDAAAEMAAAGIASEPEVLVYFARHYARAGMPEGAAAMLRRAIDEGFTCNPAAMRTDPWLAPLCERPEFREITDRAARTIEEARGLAERFVRRGRVN